MHDGAELERALAAGARLVGVNNRDLRTLRGRPARRRSSWRRAIPDDVVAVAESGIAERPTCARLRDAGFDAVPRRRAPDGRADPGAALRALLREAAAAAAGRIAALLVKICGIRSVEDARFAAAAGADAIGFVFWPHEPAARRPRAGGAIAAALPPFVLRVGVFVDAPRDEIERARRRRSGSTCCSSTAKSRPKRWAACRAACSRRSASGPASTPRTRCATKARRRDPARHAPAGRTRSPGGTGRAFDWSLARAVRAGARILRAGRRPRRRRTWPGGARRVRAGRRGRLERRRAAPGRKDPRRRMRAFVEPRCEDA